MLANLLSFTSVMKTVGGLVLAIVILLAMVTIHEFGHYVAGKLLGFRINEFSVGFGPAIFKKRSKKTGELFALRIIPLGGYCAFDGEDEDDEPEKETPANKEAEETKKDGENLSLSEGTEKNENVQSCEQSDSLEQENDGGRVALNIPADVEAEVDSDFGNTEAPAKKEEEYPEPTGARFNDQPPWKRIIVLVSGALMNYLLGVLLIILMFACYGRPMYQVVKEAPGENPHESAVETYESGLQTGDVILEINGESLYMLTDYMDALNGKNKGDAVKVLVLREGKKQTVEVTLYEDADVKNMSDSDTVLFSLGLASRAELPDEETGELKMTLTRGGGLKQAKVREGFFATLGGSFVYSFKIAGTVLRSLGELITFKLPITSMGGPVTTIQTTAQAASNGFLSFLNIAAFIGVNLAVFNLLPVPALDGCKIIFCLIEWIFKKPVNRKAEAIINFVGIVFLFGFAILVDVLHFIL